MHSISNRSSGAIGEIFGRDKVLIGMIHCPPCPGAPRYRGATMDSLYDAVCAMPKPSLPEGCMV